MSSGDMPIERTTIFGNLSGQTRKYSSQPLAPPDNMNVKTSRACTMKESLSPAAVIKPAYSSNSSSMDGTSTNSSCDGDREESDSFIDIKNSVSSTSTNIPTNNGIIWLTDSYSDVNNEPTLRSSSTASSQKTKNDEDDATAVTEKKQNKNLTIETNIGQSEALKVELPTISKECSVRHRRSFFENSPFQAQPVPGKRLSGEKPPLQPSRLKEKARRFQDSSTHQIGSIRSSTTKPKNNKIRHLKSMPRKATTIDLTQDDQKDAMTTPPATWNPINEKQSSLSSEQGTKANMAFSQNMDLEIQQSISSGNDVDIPPQGEQRQSSVSLERKVDNCNNDAQTSILQEIPNDQKGNDNSQYTTVSSNIAAFHSLTLKCENQELCRRQEPNPHQKRQQELGRHHISQISKGEYGITTSSNRMRNGVPQKKTSSTAGTTHHRRRDRLKNAKHAKTVAILKTPMSIRKSAKDVDIVSQCDNLIEHYMNLHGKPKVVMESKAPNVIDKKRRSFDNNIKKKTKKQDLSSHSRKLHVSTSSNIAVVHEQKRNIRGQYYMEQQQQHNNYYFDSSGTDSSYSSDDSIPKYVIANRRSGDGVKIVPNNLRRGH